MRAVAACERMAGADAGLEEVKGFARGSMRQPGGQVLPVECVCVCVCQSLGRESNM